MPCTTDWAATGQMITGFGTFAGALAVGFAAWVGRQSFADWKRQKNEERRMEVAEKILTLAYELRSEIVSARSPGYESRELQAAEEKLAADPTLRWELLDENERERLKLAQCTLTRLMNGSELWQKIWTLKPMALAYFGKAVERDLHVFWDQFVKIRVAAQVYALDRGKDETVSLQLHNALWGSGEADEIKAAVEAAVQSLEREMLPILRQNAGTFSKPLDVDAART